MAAYAKGSLEFSDSPTLRAFPRGYRGISETAFRWVMNSAVFTEKAVIGPVESNGGRWSKPEGIQQEMRSSFSQDSDSRLVIINGVQMAGSECVGLIEAQRWSS